jgi:hypothetical protein
MYQISGWRRFAWLSLALAALAVVATARWLSPDPAGLGTHVQLGLPPCAFLTFSGWPCPTCGLTTAFAYMARVQMAAAWRAHSLGPLLFSLTVLTIPYALHSAVRGAQGGAVPRAQSTMRRVGALPLATLTLTAALLVAWLARLAWS